MLSLVFGKSNDTAEMRGTPGNYKTGYWNILIMEINVGVGPQARTHVHTHTCKHTRTCKHTCTRYCLLNKIFNLF